MLFSREWIESVNILSEHADLPIHQVYGWILTRDNYLIIVSKDGINRQLPGGKPEKQECIQDTLKREIYEETGLKQIELEKMFGYNIIHEGEDVYLQLRYAVLLEVDYKGLVLSPQENSLHSGQIKFVKGVLIDELSTYIPWTERSDEMESFIIEKNKFYL